MAQRSILKGIRHFSQRALMILMMAMALVTSAGAMAAIPSKPPFIPIDHHYINLPDGIQPVYPTFLRGGRTILFQNGADNSAWLIRTDGSGLHCITCSFPERPKGFGFLYAFPDGRRLLLTGGVGRAADFGSHSNARVLECAPSLGHCKSHKFLPVDMSADRGDIPVFERRTWHLAPDGIHIGWMEVRSDGTVMIVATLKREAGKYVAADPRAVNPPGPVSPSDDSADRWEHLTQLYEIKSFTPDGRGIIAVGLPNDNVDMLRIDLATGQTTRLTANPDWDEDGSLSPDQKLLVSFSWRGRHRLEPLAWIPQIRGFGGLMIGAAIAPYYVSTWSGFQCDLSPWLLPAAGDEGGRLMGQPLDIYGGGLTAASHQEGQQNWSPDSTTFLLQERTRTKGRWSPSRIAMAQLGRPPSSPVRSVTSAIGSWAPPATLYRGPFAEDRSAVVRGRAGGRATIVLKGTLGGGGASTLVTFDRFTDDGATFVSGTMSLASTRSGAGEKRGWTLLSDVVVSGRHTGSLKMNLAIDNAAKPLPRMTGTINAIYDGRSAPPLPPLGPCYEALPKASPLRLQLKRKGEAVDALVTADVYGDDRPVANAKLSVGSLRVRTDARGRATLRIDGGGQQVRASAGDTFLPATATVPAG